MAQTTQQLQERLDALHQQYHLHFAGQPRVTRNLEMMRQMHRGAEAVRSELSALPENAARTAVLSLARERIDLYASEAKAIDEARVSVGDRGVEGAWLGQRANHVIHRYRRHFAGRSRSTRDVSLMVEMTADLKALRAEMSTLSSGWRSSSVEHDIGVVDSYLKLFQQEQVEIKAARDGATAETAEGIYAQLANYHFELYRLHFAGQPRVSRRPELLERMIGNLEGILSRMEALPAQGFHGEHNPQNMRVVADRLGQWREEIEQVRKVRSETPLKQMVGELGRAGEVVLEVYNERFAGESRLTRDLDLLGALCDRLWDLSRQMEMLARVQSIAENERNLEMTYDLLHMMEAEYDEIETAQKNAGGGENG